ncbi:MAG: hypothetical protein LBN96_07325 [Desulfovibrio sp.]|jgi:hypothetical protein|nr:hypothetical protein [Desulfovibrio sp.]
MPEGEEKFGQFISVDPDTLEMANNRSVGVEHVGLYAMQKLQLEKIFSNLI